MAPVQRWGLFLCSPTSGPLPEHQHDDNHHHDRCEDNRLDDVAHLIAPNHQVWTKDGRFWGWSFRRGGASAAKKAVEDGAALDAFVLKRGAGYDPAGVLIRLKAALQATNEP